MMIAGNAISFVNEQKVRCGLRFSIRYACTISKCSSLQRYVFYDREEHNSARKRKTQRRKRLFSLRHVLQLNTVLFPATAHETERCVILKKNAYG